MNKSYSKSTIIAASAMGSLITLFPTIAMAQVGTTDTGITSADIAVSTAAGAGLFTSLMILWIIIAVIGTIFFIFWIFMLIDVLKRKNWHDANQKNLWMILLIVSVFIGLYGIAAIVYYFAVKRALDKESPKPNTVNNAVDSPGSANDPSPVATDVPPSVTSAPSMSAPVSPTVEKSEPGVTPPEPSTDNTTTPPKTTE